jgi:hypothetical protein
MATLTTNVTMSDDEAADIMATALEGGIGYWCSAGEIVRRDVPEDGVGWAYVSFNAYDAETRPRNEGDEWDLFGPVTYETIRLGVNRLLSGEVQVNSDYRSMILAHFTDDDPMDAGGADCVVQAGLFNELVYG